MLRLSDQDQIPTWVFGVGRGSLPHSVGTKQSTTFLWQFWWKVESFQKCTCAGMDSTSQCTLVLSFMIMCGSQGPPECSYFWFFDKIYLITSILLLTKEIFLSTLLHCYFYPQYRSTSSTSDALDTVIWVQLGSFSYLSECNKSMGVGGHWGIQKKKKCVNYIPKLTRWKQCGSVIDLSRWMLEKAFNPLCVWTG